jgi:hypothetical protein
MTFRHAVKYLPEDKALTTRKIWIVTYFSVRVTVQIRNEFSGWRGRIKRSSPYESNWVDFASAIAFGMKCSVCPISRVMEPKTVHAVMTSLWWNDGKLRDQNMACCVILSVEQGKDPGRLPQCVSKKFLLRIIKYVISPFYFLYIFL